MNFKPQIQTGTDSFAELLLESNVFVDKSLLIQEFLEESGGKVALITRPRRWGKSLNMDMLRCFLSLEVDDQGVPLPQEQCLNHKLFTGGEVVIGPQTGKIKQLDPLRIVQQCPDLVKDYQGQYPVISLGFKDAKGSSYQEIQTKVGQELLELFTSHDYLLTSRQVTDHERSILHRYLHENTTAADLTRSLHFLSKLLYRHFGKPVYVLIDEYDTPINSAYLAFKNRPEEFEQVLQLFRGLFGAAFKSNPYLKKGLITGILRIAKANLFSDLNNVQEYSLLDENFASSYGFTQPEVDELLDKVSIRIDRAEIQRWYNGYTFGEEVIYNPWSIMSCLARKGKLGYYWIDSGGTQLIDEVLLSDKIQQDLQTLIAGGSIDSPIMKQISFEAIGEPEGLFSLLLFSGYLNPKAIDEENDVYELSIPNYELSYIYKVRLLKWLAAKLETSYKGLYTFMSLLAVGKVEEFRKRLQELLHCSTSFHQTGSKVAELFYSGFMLGLLSSLSPYYVIESERENGQGRADAVLIPKVRHGDQALVLEYKVGRDVEGLAAMAEEGLGQIVSKGYGVQVRVHGHVKRLLQVCLAFSGKEVALKYAQVAL